MQWKENQKKIRRFKRTDGLTQYFEGGCYLLNWQTRDAKLPPFDGVFFASASAVESFLAQYGASKLRGKELYVMGQPTRSALPARLAAKARIWQPGR